MGSPLTTQPFLSLSSRSEGPGRAAGGMPVPSLSPRCRGAAAAPARALLIPAPLLRGFISSCGGTGSGRPGRLGQLRAPALSRQEGMASGGGGGSGPAESLVSWDFCQRIFRRPGCLPAVSFSSQGCARNIFSSSHHPSSKAFYPLRKDLKGIAYRELISSRLPTAGIQREQQPAVLWEPPPSQAPPALEGGHFGWLVGKQPSHIPSDTGQSLCANLQHVFYLS